MQQSLVYNKVVKILWGKFLTSKILYNDKIMLIQMCNDCIWIGKQVSSNSQTICNGKFKLGVNCKFGSVTNMNDIVMDL